LSLDSDLDEWFTEILTNLMALRRQYPGSRCFAVPAARCRRSSSWNWSTEVRWPTTRPPRCVRRFPGLEPERASSVGNALMEVGTALLDRASLDPVSEQAMVRDAIALAAAYLHVIDGDVPARHRW